MSYDTAAQFAQTWGLVFLVVMFLVAVVYALWPGNRGKFERAARLPLDEESKNPRRGSPAGPHDHNGAAIE